MCAIHEWRVLHSSMHIQVLYKQVKMVAANISRTTSALVRGYKSEHKALHFTQQSTPC